uniref:Odorant-binding protein 14 n=1 Tax=Encarsia formosa TaxID=32400 RepID=A0A514TTZ8_ENCFO|nr:odorant-binding protein 14 [Encarsia formosa]
MKSLIIFVFCAAAVAHKIPITPKDAEKFLPECILESGLDPAILSKRNITAREPTPRQESCVFACVDKKTGVMKENGKYDDQFVFHSYLRNHQINPDTWRTNFYETVRACERYVGKDACKLAACVRRMPRYYWT